MSFSIKRRFITKSPCLEGYEKWHDSRSDLSNEQQIKTERGWFGSWTTFYGPEWKIMHIQNLACGFNGRLVKPFQMTFTREEADSLAMAFGVKNVWEINEGHVDENSTAQRVTWEVGEFPESVGDEVYEYQIIYLIKVFVVNACENLKWIRNESSYDQAFESETIMDPIETAYVICRRRCTEGERRVGFNYSEKEIIAELGSGINSQGQEKL